jgi:MFS family permease
VDAAQQRETQGGGLGRAGPGPFVAVTLVTAVNFLAIGCVLPVLPLYVKGPVGAGDVAVGLVIGAFAVTAAVARPIGGRLADRRTRKSVHLSGLLICALGGALLFLPFGVPGLVLARLVVGIGDGWVFTAGVTWAVDLASERRRGRAIGLFGLSIWGGISLGALIGGSLNSIAGFGWVWAFATISPLIAALLVTRVPAGAGRPQPAEEAVAAAEMGSPAAAAAPAPGPARGMVPLSTLRPGVALLMANIGFGTLSAFTILLMANNGIGHGAAVFAAFTAGVTFFRVALGWAPDRFGSRPTALVGGLVEGIGIAATAFAGTLPAAIVGATLAGLGMSLIFPALALQVVNATDESSRATAMGWFTSFFDVGVAVGAPLAGLIASLGSGNNYAAAFYVTAVLCVAGALIGFSRGREPARGAAVA